MARPLRRRLLVAAATPLAGVVSFLAVIALAPGGDAIPAAPIADEAPAHVTRGERLIEQHGCWTGEAPADVTIPGHVVVTRDGRVVYGGPRLVGQALGQVFEGEEHGLDVHAFCR
jgi:hypothetical protein